MSAQSGPVASISYLRLQRITKSWFVSVSVSELWLTGWPHVTCSLKIWIQTDAFFQLPLFRCLAWQSQSEEGNCMPPQSVQNSIAWCAWPSLALSKQWGSCQVRIGYIDSCILFAAQTYIPLAWPSAKKTNRPWP